MMEQKIIVVLLTMALLVSSVGAVAMNAPNRAMIRNNESDDDDIECITNADCDSDEICEAGECEDLEDDEVDDIDEDDEGSDGYKIRYGNALETPGIQRAINVSNANLTANVMNVVANRKRAQVINRNVKSLMISNNAADKRIRNVVSLKNRTMLQSQLRNMDLQFKRKLAYVIQSGSETERERVKERLQKFIEDKGQKENVVAEKIKRREVEHDRIRKMLQEGLNPEEILDELDND